MKALAAMTASAMAGPALAQHIACQMVPDCPEGMVCAAVIWDVNFSIDRNQFAAAVDVNEPPRRKVTQVQMGDRQFLAEPIVMGDILGFQAEGLGGSTQVMIVQPDRTARFTNPRMSEAMTGFCEVTTP